jgi:hypothetical protein
MDEERTDLLAEIAQYRAIPVAERREFDITRMRDIETRLTEIDRATGKLSPYVFKYTALI